MKKIIIGERPVTLGPVPDNYGAVEVAIAARSLWSRAPGAVRNYGLRREVARRGSRTRPDVYTAAQNM